MYREWCTGRRISRQRRQKATGVLGNMVTVKSGFNKEENFSENYPKFWLSLSKGVPVRGLKMFLYDAEKRVPYEAEKKSFCTRPKKEFLYEAEKRVSV